MRFRSSLKSFVIIIFFREEFSTACMAPRMHDTDFELSIITNPGDNSFIFSSNRATLQLAFSSDSWSRGIWPSCTKLDMAGRGDQLHNEHDWATQGQIYQLLSINHVTWWFICNRISEVGAMITYYCWPWRYIRRIRFIHI